MILKYKKAFVFPFFCGVLWLQTFAQCSFDPTITSPRLDSLFQNSVVLCQPDMETLSTQTYDSYQWYSREWSFQQPNPNPWVLIPGATSSSLAITDTSLLHYYKVACTLNTCTEFSDSILVDGFAAPLPTMATTFQPGTYEITPIGSVHVCNGASVTFSEVFDQVYQTHTWYRCPPSNLPPVPGDTCIIVNSTGPQYIATTSGSYTYFTCTEYCPNLCSPLGVSSVLEFGNWAFCPADLGLEHLSENNIRAFPNPATEFLYLGTAKDNIYSMVQITDITGKIVMTLKDHSYDQPIDISSLQAGNYSIVSRNQSGKFYVNKLIKK